jgi:Zn-dependent protease
VDQFLAYPLKEIPYVLITLMIAFTFHEFSHAYVAYKFGDMTAKNQGRLTLNPIQHLDPIGTLLIFIAGFGWARPVPVNRFFFKKPRLAGVMVSLAGPISNLILTLVGFIILFALMRTGVTGNTATVISNFLELFIQLNVVLFIFNLLPLPPLDGYRVVEDLLPNDARAKLTQYETYGSLIFLILVLTPLSRYTIQPIFSYAVPWLLNGIGNFFYQLFF